MAGRRTMPGRAPPLPVEPRVLRDELSRRHRCGTSRQASDDRHLRPQPQSHLCGLRGGPVRPIPGLLQLDTPDLHRRRRLALPSPGAARRRLPQRTLRGWVYGILPQGEKVRLIMGRAGGPAQAGSAIDP